MAQLPNPFGLNQSQSWSQAGAADPAVIRFFNSVYSWMATGLAVTALSSFLVAQWLQGVLNSGNTESLRHLGPIFIGLLILELVLVGVISAATRKLNATAATVLFLLYAAINGVTLCGLFIVYTHAALASAFLISAGTFGAMSVYGLVTKRDLSGVGHFLYMVLFGLVIASVVSLFWHNSAMQVIMNYVGVFLFVGLTAYDTQKLKEIAAQTQGDPALASRLAVNGSLILYLDFINLFLFILRLMNDRRN